MPNLVQALQGFREGSTYYATGDGFYYCLNRTKGTRKFLKCFRHGRYKCMARASFEVSERVMSVTVNHNHAPEPWVDELLNERHALKCHASRGIDFLQNSSLGRFPGIEYELSFEDLKPQLKRTKKPDNSRANYTAVQQLQEHSRGRDDPSSLEATLGMGVGGAMNPAEAGPSGYSDDVRVKMEPEWVDAGALEPNCELEGQYDDLPDYNSGYGEDMGQDDQKFHPIYSGQQAQPQQPSLIPDTQDPIKLRVPGKPNLTITVAPSRQAPSHSITPLPPPPPLHLLNPLLNRKRGRPKGSSYGTYSEKDDRMTTMLTDSIIASRKLDKERAGGGSGSSYSPGVSVSPMSAPSQSSRVKPRSRDPEAVKAAEIVNNVQNRSGSHVTEELEKVHLKLRQEVLALEVQNLKAEREKLIAYRRNVAIRREIMMLHLQLDRGIPSECASSGRGLEIIDPYDDSMDPDYSDDFANSESGELSKRIPDVSISRLQSCQSPKISVRKSLQISNQSPCSPLSSSSSLKSATPPAVNQNKSITESKKLNRNKQFSDDKQVRESDNRQLSENRQSENKTPSEGRHCSESELLLEDVESIERIQSVDERQSHSSKQGGEHCGNLQSSENQSSASVNPVQHSVPSVDSARDDLVALDSVSSDLSIEMLSEPGSSQWTQSSAPMTEHEGFDDDIQFDGDDSYGGNNESSVALGKEPPDGQYHSYPEGENPHKRRRIDNMWEPDDGSL